MNELVVDYARAGWAIFFVAMGFLFLSFYVPMVATTIHEEWRGCTKAGRTNFVRALVASFCLSFCLYYCWCRYALKLYP